MPQADEIGEIADTVYLFDVDNTLLNNDLVQDDLGRHLAEWYGEETRVRYWAIFEELRSELGYADYFGTLERYRIEYLHDPKVLRIANWLVDYPFQGRVYPDAIAAVQHAQRSGVTAILSDGDAVFQPRKVERSGLWTVFGDNVLIYVHKELELADVERHFPARHYVMIDDKIRILDAIKRVWADRVTTVFVRQGHYATDPALLAEFPPADITLESIGDLVQLDLSALNRR
jgi:FMN phosphatase YigB (HAD superfamily)